MDRIKWLLIGAGDISKKRVAPALAQANNSEIAAVCDIHRDWADALAGEYGAKGVFDNYTEALAQSGADAVYLATPVWLHVEQAIEALRAGKHVLVEKPLGLSGSDCTKAATAAAESGKKAGCAYFRRLSPRYLTTKKMLEDGEFGQVVSIRMNYFSWFGPAEDDPKYWRATRAKSGGGPLSDMGTHMFDVLIGLLGMPVSVYAKCGNLVHKWDVEDSAAVIMTMPDGALVTASFNWNSKTWRHEFEIVGTEAKIDWLPYDTGPVVKTVGRNIESLDLPPAENVHQPLVDDFVQAILQDHAPVCPLEEAAKTNVLLDAIYESAAQNKEVRL